MIKRFKWLLSVFLLSSTTWASDSDWDISVEKVKQDEIVELDKAFPGGAMPRLFSSVKVRYKDKKSHFFIHANNPTVAKYKRLLNCGGVDYPTVMLETDGSDKEPQPGTGVINTYIKNRLFIFDESLKLVKKFESLYLASVEDDGEFYVDRVHIFTLDNVEEFACKRIKAFQ